MEKLSACRSFNLLLISQIYWPWPFYFFIWFNILPFCFLLFLFYFLFCNPRLNLLFLASFFGRIGLFCWCLLLYFLTVHKLINLIYFLLNMFLIWLVHFVNFLFLLDNFIRGIMSNFNEPNPIEVEIILLIDRF